METDGGVLRTRDLSTPSAVVRAIGLMELDDLACELTSSSVHLFNDGLGGGDVR